MRMNSTWKLLAVAVVSWAIAAPSLAGEGKCPGDKKLENLSLSGTLVSEQVEKPGKDGSPVKFVRYFLQTEDERIELSQSKCSKKKGEAQIRLADYVGAKVDVTARGFMHPNKEGGVTTYVHAIDAIRRVET
jgi:hypothetical protein